MNIAVRMFQTVLSLLLCSSLVSPQVTNVESPTDSGNAFLRSCSAMEKDDPTATESRHRVECGMYVEGVDEGVSAEVTFSRQLTRKEPLKSYCRPEHSEAGQLVRISLKYIRSHP